MSNKTKHVSLVALVVVSALFLQHLGFISFHLWPKMQRTEHVAVHAKIDVIQPIVMDEAVFMSGDVRAKLTKKEGWGPFGNIDWIKLTAKGDVVVSLKHQRATPYDPSCDCYKVEIRGSMVVFDRPRIDMESTKNSFKNHDGFWHKQWNSVEFWKDDSGKPISGLYGFAQGVIGNQCTHEAWDVVKQAIIISEQERARIDHPEHPKATVKVTFIGNPSFNQNPVHPQVPHGYKLKVDPATCKVAPNALKPYVSDQK